MFIMKQIISRILIFSLVVLVACMDNSGGQQGQQQQHSNKKSQHKQRNQPANANDQVDDHGPQAAPDNGSAAGDDVIDRHPGRLIYTKHARCRMDCRHIDEAEVEDILAKGRINYRKSEPAGRPDPKYALEGATRDGQQVRVIFAPAKRGMVVITVIDLDTDWSCNCK
jgi:hypothetical protein